MLAVAIQVALAVGGCSEGPDGLESPRREERIAAVRALASRSTERSVRRLAQAASDGDRGIAAEAIRGLGRVGRPSARRALRRFAVEDARPRIRREATVQLGLSGGTEDAAVLRQTIRRDADPRVRAAAATGLGRIGDLSDVPRLVELANRDPDLRVQSCAVGAVQDMVDLRFRFDPSASEEERAEALRRMTEVAEGAAAALARSKGRRGEP